MISICMPSRNQGRFLGQTLDGVLAQTCRDFEIAFVDDGSDDDTLAIATTYQHQNPGRMKVYWHDEHAHRGISASTNLAIASTTGEFIVILDSDDVWYPDTLARRLAFMQAHPQLALSCSHYDIIDEQGRTIRRGAAPDISGICQSIAGFTHSMVMGCVVGNPTVMVRRACIEKVGRFNEELLHGDWEIWTRLAAQFPIGFMPEATVMHRRHTGNVTGSHSMKEELTRRLKVMEALECGMPVIGSALALPQIRALIHLEQCAYLFCLYDRESAARHLEQALQCNPALFQDGGVYFRTWLDQRPVIKEPRQDFHAWIRTVLAANGQT